MEKKVCAVEWLPPGSACDGCLDATKSVILRIVSCRPECQIRRCIPCFKAEVKEDKACFKCGEPFSFQVTTELCAREIMDKKEVPMDKWACKICGNTKASELIMFECKDLICLDCIKSLVEAKIEVGDSLKALECPACGMWVSRSLDGKPLPGLKVEPIPQALSYQGSTQQNSMDLFEECNNQCNMEQKSKIRIIEPDNLD